LKILHSIVLDGWSAGSWYAVNMAKHLNDQGHQNLFVCRPACRTREEAAKAGLRIHDRINLETKNPLQMIGNLSALGRLLVDWKPDAVCAHWGEDHANWGLLKFLYRSEVPLVRVRSLDPRPPKAHPLGRWLHEKETDLVIVSNEYLRGCYIDLFALPPEAVRVVPPGFDFTDFAKMPSHPSETSRFKAEHPTVGHLARFSPVKGHRVFFEAARIVAEKFPEVHFLLAGFESELKTPDLAELAEQAGVAGQTEIIDQREGSPAPIIARFDVGVVSSVYSESVSRSLMEYLAAGVPAVATEVGGVPDLLGEGELGILIPPEHPEILAAGVMELLEDHDRRRRMGSAAREFIRTRRTWEQAAENFASALWQITERADAHGRSS
jgi:glycosyltransferase involved in cell wall biosynthesis